jgi:hypothetical protein
VRATAVLAEGQSLRGIARQRSGGSTKAIRSAATAGHGQKLNPCTAYCRQKMPIGNRARGYRALMLVMDMYSIGTIVMPKYVSDVEFDSVGLYCVYASHVVTFTLLPLVIFGDDYHRYRPGFAKFAKVLAFAFAMGLLEAYVGYLNFGRYDCIGALHTTWGLCEILVREKTYTRLRKSTLCRSHQARAGTAYWVPDPVDVIVANVHIMSVPTCTWCERYCSELQPLAAAAA